MRYGWLVLLLAMAAGSCSDDVPTEPHALEELKVVTDRDSYATLEEIELIIENTTETTALLHECDMQVGFMVQEQEVDGWVDHKGVNFMGPDGPTCPSFLVSGLRRVEPGDTVRAFFDVGRAGSYRAEVRTGTSRSDMGSHRAHSNVFVVEP